MKIWELMQKKLHAQQKITMYFVRFCVFMLICGLFARGIYAYRLPKVQIASVEKKTINHTIKIDGTTQAQAADAICVEPNIRVADVFVTQGQQIHEGDQLFALDVADLQAKLQAKQQEAESIQLQISAAQTNASIAQSLVNKEKERANKDYQTSVEKGQNQITSSAQELQKAQEKLQKFDAQDAYIANEKAKDSQLQSLKNAKNQAEEKKEQAKEKKEDAKKNVDKLKKELETYRNNSQGVDETEKNTHIEELENKIQTQKEKLDTAEDNYTDQKSAYEEAKDNLESYETSIEHTLKDAWQQEKDALTEAVEQKTDTYQNTIVEEQEKVETAQREIEDKTAPQTVDNLAAINQISLAQKQEEISVYQSLLDAGGIISSTADCMVEKLQVAIGDLTPEGASMVLAKKSETYDFVATMGKEEKKYLNVGDKALVTFDEGRIEYENCEIYAIQEGSEKDTYQVHIKVPAKDLSWNQAGVMQIVKQSQVFDTCVPLQAMMAEGTQYYCLVLVEKTGFMGQEYAVEKRNVVMLDHNDTHAALQNYAVGEEESVVIYTNHMLQSGDIVRLLEE